jgi:hypothetical protein
LQLSRWIRRTQKNSLDSLRPPAVAGKSLSRKHLSTDCFSKFSFLLPVCLIFSDFVEFHNVSKAPSCSSRLFFLSSGSIWFGFLSFRSADKEELARSLMTRHEVHNHNKLQPASMAMSDSPRSLSWPLPTAPTPTQSSSEKINPYHAAYIRQPPLFPTKGDVKGSSSSTTSSVSQIRDLLPLRLDSWTTKNNCE